MEKKQQVRQTSLFDEEKLDSKAGLESTMGKFLDMLHSPTSVTTTDFPNVQELEEYFKERGLFIPLPTESVYQRSKDYYNRNIDRITKVLASSGLSETTIEVIKQDYFFALTGYYDFKAEPSQMVEAWQHLQPLFPQIFQIDRYGFYYVLMMSYYCYAKVFFDFNTEFRDGDEEKRKQYLEKIENYSFLENRAIVWFMRRGVATPFDFIEKGLDFGARIAALQAMSVPIIDYVNYFTIAKHAYMATFDELRAIKSPVVIDQPQSKDEFFLVAQTESDRIFGLLSDKAEQYAATADSNKTESEREEAIQAAQKPIGLRDEIKLPVNFNRANQKPIQAGFDWADERTYMPLTKYIMNVWPNTENGIKYTGVTVTEYTIQKAIEGLGILTNWERMKRNKIEGRLEIPTNISQFTELCLQRDASAVEKKQMLAALLLISNIYVVIDRPVRIKASSSKSKKPVKTGGRTFVKLMTLEEFNIGGNENMIITIPEKSLGGTLLPVSRKDYDRMRKEVKGSQKLRFMANILEMDNRAEDGLVDDCFGFAQLIENAQTEEDKKATREYVRKNRTSAKKRVKQWFEEYLQEGYITSYTYTQNKKGVWVYKWKRGDKKPIEEAEIVEEETKALPTPEQA